MTKLDEQILIEEKRLEQLFVENDCSNITYYVVCYKGSGNISCFFKYEGNRNKLLNWIWNGRSNRDAFAYYFTSNSGNIRSIYEIDCFVYEKILNSGQFERRFFVNETFSKMFEIYIDNTIFRFDKKGYVSPTTINEIKNKQLL